MPESLGARPPIDRPVLVHGDACAPNTLISAAGEWTGNVDFGDLAVGDRWADLAVASLSLDWNFGEGHQGELFDAYGVDPDQERIRYYRELWQPSPECAADPTAIVGERCATTHTGHGSLGLDSATYCAGRRIGESE